MRAMILLYAVVKFLASGVSVRTHMACRDRVGATIFAVALAVSTPDVNHVSLSHSSSRLHAPPSVVTFTKDVAPIVFTACASCHRPGGVGPFALITYDDVKGHAAQIV